MISKNDFDVMLWIIHDYRKLNENTVKNHILLICQNKMIEVMIQVTIYDTIDLFNAYYQISIIKENKHKIAFKTFFNMYK